MRDASGLSRQEAIAAGEWEGDKYSLAAVVGQRTRLLILGSLPGDESLRLRQYYGHPRNRFWELVGASLGEDLRVLPYERRLERLKIRGVAVWDVLRKARRRGSLDSAIQEGEPNAVNAFIAEHGIPAVAFNGQKAAELFRRHIGEFPPGVSVLTLPSSSPANASVPMIRKLAEWGQIGSFLTGR